MRTELQVAAAPVGRDRSAMRTFAVALPGSDGTSEHVTIPTFFQLVRRAGPQILEGVLIPLGVFVLALRLGGVVPAILAGLGCEAVVITRRLLQRRPIPGLMMIGAAMLVVRSGLALATGSLFVYFVQPTIGAAVVAMAFLLSVAMHRPLARRFASDFCDIPDRVHDDVRVHAYFQRCSLMWAISGFTNTGITLWLLLSQSTTMFLATKTALSFTFAVGGIVLSVVWFRRTMLRHNLITAA